MVGNVTRMLTFGNDCGIISDQWKNEFTQISKQAAFRTKDTKRKARTNPRARSPRKPEADSKDPNKYYGYPTGRLPNHRH